MPLDITTLVREKVSELTTRPEPDAWAACAAVWAHVFVLAGPGWQRWPHLERPVADALVTAILVTSHGGTAPPELIARLESFDVEDDGSTEWQYSIDTIAMLLPVLVGEDLVSCATTTLTTYLEGTFNIVANQFATLNGHPISHLEASSRVPEDETWRRAVALVRVL